jgi:hypothetical protein
LTLSVLTLGHVVGLVGVVTTVLGGPAIVPPALIVPATLIVAPVPVSVLRAIVGLPVALVVAVPFVAGRRVQLVSALVVVVALPILSVVAFRHWLSLAWFPAMFPAARQSSVAESTTWTAERMRREKQNMR